MDLLKFVVYFEGHGKYQKTKCKTQKKSRLWVGQ